MRSMKLAQKLKAATMASVLAAVSLTIGVGEAFAGVPMTAAIAPAMTASAEGIPAQPVYWRHYGWRGYGWHRGYWHRGWGWGPGYAWGGPVVYGGCWRWRATPWGPRRVWVC
ncbi:MAG: hypothetical protein WA813_24815 [Beijerinckiaceae bacterium]